MAGCDRTLAIFAPLITLVLIAGTATAAAQSCTNEIDRLAQHYNLSTDEPRAGSTEMPAAPTNPSDTTRGTITTERLAQSGGVIAPPDTGTSMEIQPPRSDPDHMPTAPHVAPNPPSNGGAEAGDLTAADRVRMESLLQAARAAERQGKDEQCLERLGEALAVPRRPSAK